VISWFLQSLLNLSTCTAVNLYRYVAGVRKEEECTVGFFYDKVGRTCTPICKPGYVYDPVLKRCLNAAEALHS
jgi:hypothetical protein